MESPVPHPAKSSRARRTLLWSLAGVAAVAIVVFGLLAARNGQANNASGKKGKKDEPTPAAPVALAPVGRGSLSMFLETTTVLEARNSATLVAKRQGQVVAIAAEEGATVASGALLARLDDAEAKIALARAQAAYDQAKRDAVRGRALADRGLSSASVTDDLDFKLETAHQGVAQAQYDLAQTRIVAPFGGKVVTRMIQLGETVTPGKDCFRVDDFDPLLARVYFPEHELPRVRVGQTATLESTALPGRAFPARVTLVNPVVDRTNGTFKVTLEVVDRTGTLRPGSFARVRLLSDSFANAVVIPRKSLVVEDGDAFVFVAAGDSVNRVAVKVGAVSGDTAQVLAGVVPGQKVVSVGQGGLKQGSRIKAVAF
jgi:membrane fusion protein (multidrug efflux system)